MDETQPVTDGEPRGDTVVIERAVLWGDTWPLDRPAIPLRFGDLRLVVERAGEHTLRVREVGTDRPPLIVELGQSGGRLAYGHVRRSRPLLLRFPRPARISPRGSLSVYSTYPIHPAIFHEAPDKSRLKILDLPVPPMPKTLFGNPDDGVVCDLHYGPAELAAGDIRFDRLHAVVALHIENRTAEPQEAGILLFDPPALDFYLKDGRLSTNAIELRIRDYATTDMDYPRRPSIDGSTIADPRVREPGYGAGAGLMRLMQRPRNGGRPT